MGLSTDIPVRSNGQEITSGWFNTIRSVLIALFGTASSGQASFTVVSGQTGTDLTGLLFDNTVTQDVTLEYLIQTSSFYQAGAVRFTWDGSAWAAHEIYIVADDASLVLSIHATTGQVEYDSGAEGGTMKHKYTSFDI